MHFFKKFRLIKMLFSSRGLHYGCSLLSKVSFFFFDRRNILWNHFKDFYTGNYCVNLCILFNHFKDFYTGNYSVNLCDL